jgi:regulation of enolase protein 1 (concanavalin A-like superfamily)
MEASENRKSKLDLRKFEWMNQPDLFKLENDSLTIITDPETDFWQRTYYGFKNDNGHTFVTEADGDFTFEVKTEYLAVNQYDQCGIILYQDSENWMKASVEYENKQFARLGSVVTNLGFSDWASTDIPAEVTAMWYRLSRRGQDFCISDSSDGITYQQMRIFHMHHPVNVARIGVYACSPLKSSFKAVFSDFDLGKCIWRDHSDN